MLIFAFTVLCVAGVAFLFFELQNSDRTTAEKLRASLVEETEHLGP